ncbi:hypothetical protein PYCCODRAFT_29906 [Trametes coccinea BRFM310]|uniref:Uncharacterized protein n=1 Tax=Trametes coccinea (strain BRFM310) TaxID=1353009 RepID=A0A1Y2J562_TRAC3|nr:hypothetical protein PYCCODRAFT_29906 [Trametes coccinea BRFM310]
MFGSDMDFHVLKTRQGSKFIWGQSARNPSTLARAAECIRGSCPLQHHKPEPCALSAACLPEHAPDQNRLSSRQSALKIELPLSRCAQLPPARHPNASSSLLPNGCWILRMLDYTIADSVVAGDARMPDAHDQHIGERFASHLHRLPSQRGSRRRLILRAWLGIRPSVGRAPYLGPVVLFGQGWRGRAG